LFTTPFNEVLDFVELVFRDDDDTVLPADGIEVDWTPYNRLAPEYGFGSATDAQAAIAKIDDLEDVAHLVGLLNDNNARGRLRQGNNGSLVTMLRHLYECDRGILRSLYGDPSAQTFDLFRIRIICLYWQLIQLFFRAANVNLAAVKKLDNPFTFDGINEMSTIVRENPNALLGQFNAAADVVDRRLDEAEQKVSRLRPTSFMIQLADGSGSKPCGLIETNDRLVASQWFQLNGGKYGVVIVRRTDTRQYSIFCRGQQDFTDLRDALVAADADGAWYLEHKPPQSPMLLNGSASRSAAISELRPQQVIDLVREHVRFVPYVKPAAARPVASGR
jgi:hypothetical protein